MMKGAILIYGNNAKLREQKANSFVKDCDKSDLMTLSVLPDKKSIGIEQIRGAISFIQKKPFAGDMKAIIVPNAEKLTTEAQNAMLKTLEETPPYASVLLLTKTQESLLPTVLSRCQKVSASISIDDGFDEDVGGLRTKADIKKIKKMSVNEKFNWAQEQAKEEKEDLIELLEDWVKQERSNLYRDPDKAKNIKLILEVRNDLERTNLNSRLALETLILNLV